MLRWLAFRDLIGRLLRTWSFWITFVALATVRIYLDTVLADTVRYQSRIISSFLLALVATWTYEACERQPPPQT